MDFIFTTLAVLAVVSMLCVAVMFVYWAGQLGGAVAGAVLWANGAFRDQGPKKERTPSEEELRLLAEAARIEARLRKLEEDRNS